METINVQLCIIDPERHGQIICSSDYFVSEPVEINESKLIKGVVISPFNQSYAYRIVGFYPVYNLVNVIPICKNGIGALNEVLKIKR